MNPELSCRSQLRTGTGVQSFSRWRWPALGSLGSQPPCLLLPLPLLLPGTKEAGGAASCKAGRPCAPPPGPSSSSCYPFPSPHPEGADRDTRGRRGETPTATSSHQKALPRPDPWPSAPARLSSIRHWPWGAGCLSPGGAHQENSREQTFASCSGLGFSSGDTGCILPAWTSAGRGRGVGAAPGHTQVWSEAAGAADEGGGGTARHGAQDPRRPRSQTGLQTLPNSEPRPPPRKWRGRGRLQQKRPSAVVKTGKAGRRR